MAVAIGATGRGSNGNAAAEASRFEADFEGLKRAAEFYVGNARRFVLGLTRMG